MTAACLARLGLDNAGNFAERAYRALVTAALLRSRARVGRGPPFIDPQSIRRKILAIPSDACSPAVVFR